MIRYAVIGCGGHSKSHVLPGRQVKDLELVALFDPKPSQAEEIASLHGGEGIVVTSDFDGLMQRPDIDAVLITSPDAFHTVHLEAAIQAKKHVLVDKPVAVTNHELKLAGALLEEAKKMGLVVTSCHPRRFDPPYVWLKANSSRFELMLGKVVHFDLDFSYHQSEDPWKHSSLMMDHLNHEIDLLHFLYGIAPFAVVEGYSKSDRYSVSGVRREGTTFSFHGTRCLESRVYKEWVRVRHERGEVRVYCQLGVVEIENHDTGAVITEFCGPTNYDQRNLGIMQNFVDAIKGRAQNYLTSEEILMNTLLAIQLQEKGMAQYG